ncbi:hypothetical protein Dimus_020134 [Dionaea muscipula]
MPGHTLSVHKKETRSEEGFCPVVCPAKDEERRRLLPGGLSGSLLGTSEEGMENSLPARVFIDEGPDLTRSRPQGLLGGSARLHPHAMPGRSARLHLYALPGRGQDMGFLKGGSTSFRASWWGFPGLCGFCAGRIQATGFPKGVAHPSGHRSGGCPAYAASVRDEPRHRIPKGGSTSFRTSPQGLPGLCGKRVVGNDE